MATAEKEKKTVIVPPFAMEAKTPRNGDLMVQALGGVRLRGAVRASVEVFDRQLDPEDIEDGKETRPTSAKLVDGIPETPGMILAVNPAALSYKIYDPLYKNEKTLDRIKRSLSRATGIRTGTRLRGIAPKEGKLNEHEMKTLVREMVRFIEAEEGEICKGVKPDMEDVDELPGHYLLNPMGLANYHQPKFEHQEKAWRERMDSING